MNSPVKSDTTHDATPLLASTKKITVVVDHELQEKSIQYEFYIPAYIWRHSAVKAFINKLKQHDPSATIFKGVTGVWKGDKEDTNIYRMIRRSREIDPNQFRKWINEDIGEMMAKLSEWDESNQETFLFTEAVISTTFSEKR